MPHILLVIAVVVSAACGSSPSATPSAATTQAAAAASRGPGSDAAPVGPPLAEGQVVRGVVAETMNSGGYTYMRLTGATDDLWVASTEMPVAQGAEVTATVSVVMDGFHSRTLNRDFPRVAFVSDVTADGVAVEAGATSSSPGAGSNAPALVGSHGAAPTAASPGGAPPPPAPALIEKVAPAPGGLTVFQVWQTRADLRDKTVVVRGRVVKANYEIMGTHWYHLQDGTGEPEAGTHDLTVTSRERMNVGDVVTISGPIALGKDFGAGYAYDVMVDGASLVK